MGITGVALYGGYYTLSLHGSSFQNMKHVWEPLLCFISAICLMTMTPPLLERCCQVGMIFFSRALLAWEIRCEFSSLDLFICTAFSWQATRRLVLIFLCCVLSGNSPQLLRFHFMFSASCHLYEGF